MKHLLSLVLLACAIGAEPFELRNGDSVVLLGNTLIEREQKYGYWETLLASQYPDRNVTFRNLGWSGDTVFGEARAGFGTMADGFQHLREHVLALKPTVIFVGYGGNEAFGGEAELPRFLQGLDVLLSTLEETKARIVLLSPPRQEWLGGPFPPPNKRNRDLQLYRDALKKVAQRRKCWFVDLFDFVDDSMNTRASINLTDNGLHFTGLGYWQSASDLGRGLGWKTDGPVVEFDGMEQVTARGARVKVESGSRRFKVTADRLASPMPEPGKAHLPQQGLQLRIRGLAQGNHRLTIDGKESAAGSDKDWARGIKLKGGPDSEQAERLRAAIVEKNRLYFYRWRPQNETYLFGFRKHEQGQNAREVPLFDPLIEKLEAEIARLRVPVVHQYELVRMLEDKP